MEKLTRIELVRYLEQFRGKQLSLQDIMKDLQIRQDKQGAFRKMLSLLANDKDTRIIKSVGSKSGLYKVLYDVKPITTLGNKTPVPFDIAFPYGYEDCSTFGFEESVEIDEGDVIIIAGVSNSAKTALVINMLAANMDKHKCLLMGNEYAREDGELSPKFIRRMKRMNWANWENGSGELKFTIIPIDEDYEDWVEAGMINFIDWINLEENFYQIGAIIKAIKKAVCTGVAVIVLQKGDEAKLGRGKDFTRDLADFYVTIDPMGSVDRRLTVIKAKAPTKGYMDGRMWGFKLVEGGTKLHDIREIVRCPACYGKGYTGRGSCDDCGHLGYTDK